MIMFSSLKGYHYRAVWFYDLMDLLKRGMRRDLRFFIAARHVHPGDSVVDVCAGPGHFQAYLPCHCSYTAVDVSPGFLDVLRKKGVRLISCDLHAGYPVDAPWSEVLVMIISLAHFRATSVDGLLEAFKKKASRVIVVEEVLTASNNGSSWYQRAVDHLCAIDAYVPVTWYTHEECERVLSMHGYRCERVGRHHIVGTYNV